MIKLNQKQTINQKNFDSLFIRILLEYITQKFKIFVF